MKVNNIEISDIILNDIFIILEYFLYQKDISQLLDISKASFYKYKREKKNKFIDRKLYNLYLIITNENFENEIKSCENINLEW